MTGEAGIPTQAPAPILVPDRPANMSDPQAPAPERGPGNVRITSRRDVGSMLELDPDTMDPTRHYRFVRRDSSAVLKARIKGYTQETTREGGPRLAGDLQHDDAGDGSINIGDTILMSCPKERFDERQADYARISEQRLEATEEETKEKIRKTGHIGGRQAIKVITDKE